MRSGDDVEAELARCYSVGAPDRSRLKLCNIVDEHTREALATDVGRNCTADDVVTIIERLVAQRGAPEHLRMDNGPELIAWALRDWCRLHHTTTTYIDPARPGRTPSSRASTAEPATSC